MGKFSLSLSLFSLSGYPKFGLLYRVYSLRLSSGHSVQVLLFFFLLIMLPSEIPKLPTDPPVRGFPGVWNLLLLHDSLLRMGLHPWLFSLYFGLLCFVLPPFKENRLPFWVAGVFRRCSEVVLWKLLSIQMIFWWIGGGESGVSVLFFCHLRIASTILFSMWKFNFFSHQVYIYVWIWLWSFYCVLFMFCLSLLWFHIV